MTDIADTGLLDFIRYCIRDADKRDQANVTMDREKLRALLSLAREGLHARKMAAALESLAVISDGTSVIGASNFCGRVNAVARAALAAYKEEK
jgi:hypothetical protein